jgi:D-alanyl-lipoteichoic acid acyltransferase DltB (MBOAT superfamily)
MLFNSYMFIFVFLPAAVAGFFLIARVGGKRIAQAWLVAVSLAFYSWDNPALLLPLILGSAVGNYCFGLLLGREGASAKGRVFLAVGVAANLALLGYFKYANFFADNLQGIFPSLPKLDPILLPLGISFYTFQQIAYLVDAYRGLTREYDFLRYCLFVKFYPQLVAGPIVHHGEILPQFAQDRIYKPHAGNFAVGITIFVIGLFKKVLIADQIGPTATLVFDAAAGGHLPTFAEAWLGTAAYAFQIYFDFSGYSDMAIGLGRMLGIRIPLNFASPYKAVNIIDFWRRWHMTLSRFLRDYLYFSLGGNRKGKVRRYVNLMLTMLLGGLWHGAGWTFLVWGGLHGTYLCINHGWHALMRALGRDPNARGSFAGRAGGWAVTFLAVLVAWVFFRARGFDAAWRMLSAMMGLRGLDMAIPFRAATPLLASAGLLAWVVLAPNTQQWLASFKPAYAAEKGPDAMSLPRRFRWRPIPPLACATAVAAVIILMKLRGASEFIYWQF